MTLSDWLGDFICPSGVDAKDYSILSDRWFDTPGSPSADIAPPGGDSAINWLDLKVFVDNWLEE